MHSGLAFALYFFAAGFIGTYFWSLFANWYWDRYHPDDLDFSRTSKYDFFLGCGGIIAFWIAGAVASIILIYVFLGGAR